RGAAIVLFLFPLLLALMILMLRNLKRREYWPMATAPRTQRQKEIRRHLWIYAAITPYVVLAIFPIYWMALTALKQDPDLYRMDQFPLWFHLPPTLKHFTY